MEEDPIMEYVVAYNSITATLEENQAQEYHIYPPPESYRLMEDHLVSIFEMRRDLAEQWHHHSFFNKCLDGLYDSLLGDPERSHCLKCCHPFTLRLHQDGSPGSPHA
jgi:hypothetical protein